MVSLTFLNLKMQNNDKILLELTNKQVYFFDLDGTLYLENKLFKGVAELINTLKTKKKFFYFAQSYQY